MGSRGNIGFVGSSGQDCIWLYTHWMGHSLPLLAQKAIEVAKPRWGDPPYATRMALTALIGSAVGETGWGIDTEPGDNEHDFIIIDWQDQLVKVIDSPSYWATLKESGFREAMRSDKEFAFDEAMKNVRAVERSWN